MLGVMPRVFGRAGRVGEVEAGKALLRAALAGLVALVLTLLVVWLMLHVMVG